VTEQRAVLGARLRARRKSGGLSQEQLAQRAGMSIRALRDIESGRTEYPHAGSLRRLADAVALQGEARAEFLELAQRPGPAVTMTPARVAASARVAVVPRQLPPSVRQFAGRTAELTLLTRLAREAAGNPAAVVISAVDGSAGIGKTALAVQFAHQAAESFPDGQLYVNLAGFGPAGPPVEPARAVRGFLDEQALRIYQELGNKPFEAYALNTVGWHHVTLGDYHQARALCQEALDLAREAGDPWTQGYAWDSVGRAEHHLGNLTEAADCYERSISIGRETGDRYIEGAALDHLGDTLEASGDLPAARKAWQQALPILDDLNHPDAEGVRAKLATASSLREPT
jgi:transcriptional regulator with XRE-family HTH domain